ncbi:MAG: PadR family transcriptional regulator [Armatimonadota bacterium]|nr:PadR family transcriptional regulator [Armatimonadota bacterium]MDR7436694.1 PadR family transcriptional regulator [Armatimonadota bacterium]MDR7471234.1 PadR family transcriptional regulator [Armatimonadota bacterium]MDR7507842.1 PadR family transcriptional regulator [Armatimonadota bacterium]MDR7510127.1 PadR family transcriptional regulator [Armatimonadota bacterium]
MFARPWMGFGPFRERLFGKGDLKVLILDLLKDRPMHGYDIIRSLQEQFGGFYAPSPGAVYPTLQMLEDMGYVTSSQQDGKKVYAITDEGRRFLTERQEAVEDIRSRFSHWWDWWGPAYREMWDLFHTLRSRGPWQRITPEKLRRIRDVMARARREIEAILREEAPAEAGPPQQPQP